MAQMERVTQQNAALVEEASAAAQSMREQAGGLAAAVGRFKLQEEGGAARPQPPVAPRPELPAAAGRALQPAPAGAGWADH